jgi:protein-disulfide isomerase
MSGWNRMAWRSGLLALATVACALPAAHAQFSETPQVPQGMMDSPALKPPAGANVAIVEFADLECPACAAENPTLMTAVGKYHVPWLRHDFPLPQHNWSFQAAVNARWLDEKSKQLGNDYRNAIFAEQQSISTPDDLNQATQKFAQEHQVQMPFVVDPQGKLAGAIRADRDLGRELGVNRTPTVWVVTEHSHDPGHPFVQVTDPQMLYAYLDQALSATGGAGAGTHKAHAGQ